MAELKQLEALRRQNKRLLEKLTKQAEIVHESKLSRPDEEVAGQSSVCEVFTGCSGQRRAPLAERNGDLTVTGRASVARASYKPKTKLETFKTPGERFDGDGKVPMPDQHKHDHTSALTAYSKLLQDTGHRRTTRLIPPKTAPLTQDKMQENDTASERQRIQPLLGYDWIAGLVDVESSLSERPEHFFSELQSFRQVNRDECVHSLLSGPPLVADLASSTVKGEEPQEPADMHQCTFCYRINSRLFATPLDPQAACPVCKMPKSNQPHTDAEPAIIRVSIPRSTLLPSYKYNAHRRCSFDPSDSLGLPSHCLSGWSNPTLNSGSLMSSLDLRGSLTTPAAGSTLSCSNNKLLLHGSCPSNCANSGAEGCSGEKYLRQGRPGCERCTQRCSAEYNQVEVTSCTSAHNRVCHCKPGFFCTYENNYVTFCHKPCVPCVPGTFSNVSSLNPSCTPYTDCVKSEKMLKEGTTTKDRECGHARTTPTMMTTPTIPATPSKIIIAHSRTTATTPSHSHTDFTTINAMTVPFIQTSNSLPLSHPNPEASPTHRMHSRSATGTTSASTAPGGNLQLKDSDTMSKDGLILLMLLMILMLLVAAFCILRKSTALKSFYKWTGFISGKHEHPDWRKCQDAHRISSNSQFQTIAQLSRSVETELPLCSEVIGQNMGVTSNSGGGQRVSMEHNVKGENVSNTVGSIYIYSPGTVILGSNSGDKKEDAGVCEEDVPLISPPQQESTPPSQEVRIRMSAQEEEATLSFPVPATGK
ncbi:uncharacterized protein LOC130571448 isoform X2 [Triplophysa rosa]|uniref:uncharacterized protein LOC130571448 isoform X2 n=1 Tax=Triplophysa rosa TaxID=992332 RepID=UPI002545CBAA|nr:uncharacterized protein LOC130571448 isoform X2 [Triplophysa rosa]